MILDDFWKKYVSSRFERKLTDADAELLNDYFRIATETGIHVSWKSAMEFSVSLACARAIATALMVPFKLFRLRGNNRTPATDHPLYDKMFTSPNDWQTGPEMRESMGYHLVLSGGAYVWKNVLNGEIAELLPYQPGQIEIEWGDWERRFYVITKAGKREPIPSDQMWYIPGPSWNTWMGLDGVRLAREALGLGMAAQTYGMRFFKNNAVPSGILSSEQSYPGEEKAKELRKAWQDAHGGENQRGTAILWNGLKWLTMQSQNDNAQMIETRKFQVEEVCRMFGVNPLRVYSSDKASTYASAEQFFVSHVVYDLLPWYVRFEMSANKNLLTEKERRAGYYWKFITNSLMRGSLKDRVMYYKGMSEIRAMKPNEIRELEEMDPYDGGDDFPILQGQSDAREEGDKDADKQI